MPFFNSCSDPLIIVPSAPNFFGNSSDSAPSAAVSFTRNTPSFVPKSPSIRPDRASPIVFFTVSKISFHGIPASASPIFLPSVFARESPAFPACFIYCAFFHCP